MESAATARRWNRSSSGKDDVAASGPGESMARTHVVEDPVQALDKPGGPALQLDQVRGVLRHVLREIDQWPVRRRIVCCKNT